MKLQLPIDVVCGGRYSAEGHPSVIVTAVKPKGRGFYVTYEWSSPTAVAGVYQRYSGRSTLADFRKTYINQRAA